MQHLEGSGMPVLYIGHTVLKGYLLEVSATMKNVLNICCSMLRHPKVAHNLHIIHPFYTLCIQGHTFHYHLPCYYSSLTNIHNEAANLTITTICHYSLLVCISSELSGLCAYNKQANRKFQQIVVQYNKDPVHQMTERAKTQV